MCIIIIMTNVCRRENIQLRLAIIIIEHLDTDTHTNSIIVTILLSIILCNRVTKQNMN